MIEKIKWDSNFFKRKIGKLRDIPPDGISLKKLLLNAKNNGFSYIFCRIDASEIQKVQLLERCGFYICDAGVTWKISLRDKEASIGNFSGIKLSKRVKVATSKDVVELKDMAKGLFYESRFYNDPFYTEVEADALHSAWVENSIKGVEADAVFFIKKSGFITCKKIGKNNGVIPLIGVVPLKRKSGIGSALLWRALGWFYSQDISAVRVRTQVYNIPAMNFYRRWGFSIDNSDITMAIILYPNNAVNHREH